jgi:glyoxylase I family protein
MGVHHAAVTVKDMEKSLEFYRDALGLNVVVDTMVSGPEIDESVMESGASIRMVMLGDRKGGMLELLEWRTPAVRERSPAELKLSLTGIVEICLEVDDMDALGKKLAKKGIKFRYPPFIMDVPEAHIKARLAHLVDPDGAALELIQTKL